MSKSFAVAAIAVAALACGAKAQQTTALTCVTTAQPPLVHVEGLTERVGDFVFDCSGGTPNGQIVLDLSVFLNVNITNRINATNQTDAVMVTADIGNGAVVIGTPGVLVATSEVTFNGLVLPLSSSGTVRMRISGLRGNASQVSPTAPFITATVSLQATIPLALTSATLTVAQAAVGLYSSEEGTVACDQRGSSAASTLSFAAFIAHQTSLDAVRVTEGYAYALAPKADVQNLNADTGTRILLQYQGAPAGTVFYVPDVVAGSDATEATSAGAYGVPVSGGKYTPTATGGGLLLARVYGADSNGAGGTPAYTPGAPGSGTVALDKLGAAATTNGAGYVVYEVVDAKGNVRESAQIPVFITFAPINSGLTYNLGEQVSLAPVSSGTTASTTAAIPRFTGAVATSDCPVLDDCTVPTKPSVRSITSSANFTPGTVVAGSLATIMGSNLDGEQLIVAFNGEPASVLYHDPRQINVMVPSDIAASAQAQLLLIIDGKHFYSVVPLQAFSPGVFPAAVLNQDNSLNTAVPAKAGTIIQIWGTGIAPNGVVTATMGGQPISAPVWWGPAPGIPGVQQVNLLVPWNVQANGNTTTFSICENSSSAPGTTVCSPERPLNVSQ